MNYKNVPVLTNKTLAQLKELCDNQDTCSVTVSLDLNQSTTEIRIENGMVVLPSGETFTIPDSFSPELNVCYFVKDGLLYPLQFFDQVRGFSYQLVPTSFRPILRISATQMHKKPFLDRLEKERPSGVGLDGGTGLGYSVIVASRTATHVITVEWDPNVLEMATYNPHSRELFERENIRTILGDLTKEIKSFKSDWFDFIIQDGGMPKSSGEFFSQSHALELFRVMKRGGNLYFYLPRKGITKGRDFGQEQITRLRKAGFELVERDMDGSYGIFRKPTMT